MRSLSLKLGLTALLLAGFVVSFSMVRTAQAMPNFARKYGLGCGSCHDVVPKLNEFGWKFRAAGYRMPDEIGGKQPEFNLGDYFAGRINMAINQTSVTAAAPGSPSVSNFNMAFTGGSIYMLFGALTPNISSESELGFSTSGTLSVSTASAGYYAGNEDDWFSARIGVINTLQGYGGSDRGWSGSPLMSSAYAYSLQPYIAGDKLKPTYTGLSGSNMGLDLGYVFGEAAIHAEVLSGYTYSGGKPSAAEAGKPAGVGAGQAPSANDFDYMFWANYILTDNGGGVSAAYYLGSADINTNANTSNVDSSYWQNKFSRYAIYASYPIPLARGVLIEAGYEGGKDNTWTLKDFAYGPDANSHGYFGEADYPITDLIGVGARYDAVTPDNSNSGIDNINVVTGYLDYNMGNGLSVTASYSAKSTDTPTSNGADLLGTAKNNAFALKITWFQ